MFGSAKPDCAEQLHMESGNIERITDGDTVVLTDNRRVRLIGINTLELNEPNDAHRKAAIDAKEALAAMLPDNEPVILYVGAESHDRHNRLLAHVVRKSDHLAVAPALISQGHAIQSAVAPNTICAEYFATLERSARNQSLGVWRLASSLTTPAESISKKSRGFKIISGTVTNVRTETKRTKLMLDDRVAVLVRPELVGQFENKRTLQQLIGRTVEVRGWLSRQKNQTRLWLQHPANLGLLDE